MFSPPPDEAAEALARDPIDPVEETENFVFVIDAPQAVTPLDWSRANDTFQKSASLGIVEDQQVWAGNHLAANTSDWFQFSTPVSTQNRQMSLKLDNVNHAEFTATLYDAEGNVLVSQSDSDDLILNYEAS